MPKAKVNSKKLEEALNSNSENKEQQTMTTEQEIAFHQGALTTLVKERDGLMQMFSIVETTIQAHVKRLKELGIKFKKTSK